MASPPVADSTDAFVAFVVSLSHSIPTAHASTDTWGTFKRFCATEDACPHFRINIILQHSHGYLQGKLYSQRGRILSPIYLTK